MIKDMRDRNSCPCLKNFAKMPATQLKELCVLAYERQMKDLEKTEGADVKLLKELKSELKEVKAVDPELADKKAKKYETAFK